MANTNPQNARLSARRDMMNDDDDSLGIQQAGKVSDHLKEEKKSRYMPGYFHGISCMESGQCSA
jgi:hypothetical protein